MNLESLVNFVAFASILALTTAHQYMNYPDQSVDPLAIEQPVTCEELHYTQIAQEDLKLYAHHRIYQLQDGAYCLGQTVMHHS